MTKSILITGCSTGVGLSLAVAAGKAGHRVFATMRNLDKREALDAAAAEALVGLEVRALDVQNQAQIDAVVGEIESDFGGVDVLVANAGAGFIRSTEQASEDEIARVTDINYMGVVRSVKAVLPAMRKRKAGHIIAVTSVGGLVGQPFNEFYCAAKFAVEGYIEALASYVRPAFGIEFSLIEPGGISTDFAANVMADVGATGGILDDAYKPVLEAYLGGMRARSGAGGDGSESTLSSFQTADEVAEVILGVIGQSAPPLRVRTSDWAEEFCRLKTEADPDGTKLRDAVVDRFLPGLET